MTFVGYPSATAHVADVVKNLTRRHVYPDRCGAMWTARECTVAGVNGWRVGHGELFTQANDIEAGVRVMLGVRS